MKTKEVYYPIMRRRNMWFKRLQAEYKYCTGTAFFVTLTYDDTHVPFECDNDGYPLFYRTSKRDVQLWFKRMRKQYTDLFGRVRYFIVSEFGENTLRPHYHAIIFTDNKSTLRLMTEAIMKTWQKGYIIDVQFLRGVGGIRYVTNYIVKGIGSFNTFCLMSRRPGIGYRYCERLKSFHRGNYKPHEVKDDALREVLSQLLYKKNQKKIDFLQKRKFFVLSNINPTAEKKPSLPRYFRDHIYTKFEQKLLFRRFLEDADKRFSTLDPKDRHVLEKLYDEREAMAKSSFLRSLSKHGGGAILQLYNCEEVAKCKSRSESRHGNSRLDEFGTIESFYHSTE